MKKLNTQTVKVVKAINHAANIAELIVKQPKHTLKDNFGGAF